MLLTDKHIAIIGGGPGGLTLARLLQRKGAKVKVYERDKDKSIRQQGATLDLHYDSGLKALRAAGLMEAFRQHYRPGAERITITDHLAAVHYSEAGNEPLLNLHTEHARPEIDRGPLRDLLIDSLEAHTVVWDSNFSALRKNGTGWNLSFKNGTTAYADLVIAADGANSKVRKYITGIKRIYSGFTIVEGNVYQASFNAPRLWKLTAGGKVFAHSDSKTIVLSAKGEGSLSFYTITKETEQGIASLGINFSDKDQVFNWFKNRFSDWSTDWHEIFSTDDSYFVLRPQYYFPADQCWPASGNLTIIGDAAHQVPPSGDGVNQAMLDALELYEALYLGKHTTLKAAIGSFEKKMLDRTALITTEALQLVAHMQAENNLQFMLDFFRNPESPS